MCVLRDSSKIAFAAQQPAQSAASVPTANLAAQTGVNAGRVKPEVRDGVVTLSATVPSASVKATILDTVRKTSGVKSVIDRIEVKS